MLVEEREKEVADLKDFELRVIYTMLIRNGFNVVKASVTSIDADCCYLVLKLEYFGEDGGQRVFDVNMTHLRDLIKFKRYIAVTAEVEDVVLRDD